MAAAIGGKEYMGQPLVVGEVVDEMGRAATARTRRCYAALGGVVGARGSGRPAAAGSRRRRKGPCSTRCRVHRTLAATAAGGKRRWMTTNARRRTAAVRLANVSMTAGLLETSAAVPKPLINNPQKTTAGGTGPAYAGCPDGSLDLTSFEHVFDSGVCPLPPSDLRSGRCRRLTSWRCCLRCRVWCRGYGGGRWCRSTAGDRCRWPSRPEHPRK